MPAIIEVRGLTKDYVVGFVRKRRVRVLDDLRLDVEAGEIFGFLGANGAGKTTTMKLLMRLIYPTAGTATICGHDIGDVEMHRSIGYLPEQPYFYDYLTAREFVQYCAQLFGCARRERKARAASLLERVGLERAAWDRQLRRFSKGMLQRVGLAQALVNEPRVVFLDEPMTGLDPIGRREIRDLLGALRASGVTVFFSSHIVADIEVLCDRVAILQRGRLAHVGRLDELQRSRGAGGERLEITVVGADVEELREAIVKLDQASLTITPGGLRIDVASERDVDEALALARACGARLVSVQPVKQSLEDLFLTRS